MKVKTKIKEKKTMQSWQRSKTHTWRRTFDEGTHVKEGTKGSMFDLKDWVYLGHFHEVETHDVLTHPPFNDPWFNERSWMSE